MDNTLIVQSHRSPLPYPWIERCLKSVRDWCDLNHYQYQFIGDELFDVLAEPLLKKTRYQKVIATDLARLYLLQNLMREKNQTVIWMDADFLIFDPVNFVIPTKPSYAVGREVWVQHDKRGKLKVYKKVHNAFLMFRPGNAFLDFYLDTAQRLLTKNKGEIPAQFIGPKLLTALHNIASFPILETAGMLSPLVIKDLLQGKGEALALFIAKSEPAIAAANLCVSSCDNKAVSETQMEKLIDSLLIGKPALA